MTSINLTFGRGQGDLSAADVEEFLLRLDAAANEDRPSVNRDNASFRSRLHDYYGEGFDQLELVHSAALEVADWAAKEIRQVQAEDPEHNELAEYYSVMQGLVSRGLLAYAEVCWLLRGGFPHGAYARARTMHEVWVAAAILAQYSGPHGTHPELVERYVVHHQVFSRSIADALTGTGILDEDFFSEEVLSSLDSQHEALIGEYGKAFKRMWGWAAPLFPDGSVSLFKLGSLIAPEMNYFYAAASVHVHAGSEGLWGSQIEIGNEKVLLDGPIDFGLEVPARLATAFILGIMEVAVPSVIERDAHVDTMGDMYLAGLSHLADEALVKISHGASSVKQRSDDHQGGHYDSERSDSQP